MSAEIFLGLPKLPNTRFKPHKKADENLNWLLIIDFPPGSLMDNDDLLDYEPDDDEPAPSPLHNLPLHDLAPLDDKDREIVEGMRAFDRLAGL